MPIAPSHPHDFHAEYVALAFVAVLALTSMQSANAMALVPLAAVGGDGYYLASDEGMLVTDSPLGHDDGRMLAGAKDRRSAAQAKGLPQYEHVCPMTIRSGYQPRFGHEQNGSRVEIQQDEERQFSATFVECESTKRSGCFGIDAVLYTSECVTLYEYRSAGIRLQGSTAPFKHGFIKVPIACQCHLRRRNFTGLKMTDAL